METQNTLKKWALFGFTALWVVLSALHLGFGLHASATSVQHFSGWTIFFNQIEAYVVVRSYPFTAFTGLLFGIITVYGVKSKTARLWFGILPFVVQMLCCIGLRVPYMLHYYNQPFMDVQTVCTDLLLFATLYVAPFVGVLVSKGVYPLTKKWEDRVANPAEIRPFRGFLAFVGGLFGAVAFVVLLLFLYHLFFD